MRRACGVLLRWNISSESIAGINWAVPATPQQHRGLLPFLGLACGTSVAAIYYNQPLLYEISRSFHARSGQTGAVAVATQLGYAVGILLFVPLGDVAERRGLITWLFAAVGVAMLVAAAAPSLNTGRSTWTPS